MVRTNRNVAPEVIDQTLVDNIDLDDCDGNDFFGSGNDFFDDEDYTLAVPDVSPQLLHTSAGPVSPPPDATSSQRKNTRMKDSSSYLEDDEEQPTKSTTKATKRGVGRSGGSKASEKNSHSASKIKDQSQETGIFNQAKRKVNPRALQLPMAASIPSTQPTVVAAAGQFGGRQNRGSSFGVLPKSINNKKLPLSDGVKKPQSHSVKSEYSMSNQENQISLLNETKSVGTSAFSSSAGTLNQHSKKKLLPPKKEFCGLNASDTTFYPFMASLPPEPTIKSRKTLGLIDSIHSQFLNHLANPGQQNNEVKSSLLTEPIVKLLEESFKEDVKATSSALKDVKKKSNSTSASIALLRNEIARLGKREIAESLFMASSLLQKQHDFLQQNASNMKRWCKKNCTESDYFTLYVDSSIHGEKGKEATILESFRRRELKVRISCNGFKDSTYKLDLVAMLPPRFEPPPPPPPISVNNEMGSVKVIPTTKSKKRKLSSAPPEPKYSTIESSTAPIAAKPSPISYASMKPVKRRKCIADFISKAVGEVEAAYADRSSERRQSMEVQENRLRRFYEEDNVNNMLHTAGMWQYLDRTGYFSSFHESEIQKRLDEIRSPYPVCSRDAFSWEIPHTAKRTDEPKPKLEMNAREIYTSFDDSVAHRIQSLLVNEEMGRNGEFGDALDEIDIDIIDESMTSHLNCVDLTSLNLDERLCLNLRGLGLAEIDFASDLDANPGTFVFSGFNTHPTLHPCNNLDTPRIKPGFDQTLLTQEASTNGNVAFCDTPENDLESVMQGMIQDLNSVTNYNNRRAALLDAATKSCDNFELDVCKRRTEEESKLISECQQLLLRTKEESKAKIEKTKSNDGLALPW